MADRKVIVKPTILDKPLVRPKTEVSLSAFAFLFSEIVQYSQTHAMDLEKKMEGIGYGIGLRVVELVPCRDKTSKRETRLVNMLQYISNTIWKYLFNKVADNLERSMENEDEYMIHEYAPVTNTFIDVSQVNCAAFLAGIIAGVLDGSRFNARVTAHTYQGDNTPNSERTIYLIKFSQEVMSRERKLG